jgi:hypothetical protein
VFAINCSNNPYVWGDNYANLPHVLLILVDILDTELSNDELNPRIRAVLTGMHASDPSLLAAAAQQITPEHQQKLQETLAGR